MNFSDCCNQNTLRNKRYIGI